jgi:hypothetical protein
MLHTIYLWNEMFASQNNEKNKIYESRNLEFRSRTTEQLQNKKCILITKYDFTA